MQESNNPLDLSGSPALIKTVIVALGATAVGVILASICVYGAGTPDGILLIDTTQKVLATLLIMVGATQIAVHSTVGRKKARHTIVCAALLILAGAALASPGWGIGLGLAVIAACLLRPWATANGAPE